MLLYDILFCSRFLLACIDEGSSQLAMVRLIVTLHRAAF